MISTMNNNYPILQFNNVVKTYNNGEIICPVDDISLSCEKGDFISIKGPSGTGKSTLLYLLGGLLKPDSGNIILNGQNFKNLTERELTILRAINIGIIFQEPNLFQALTVEENLTFVLELVNKYREYRLSKVKINEMAELYLKRLGIWDKRFFLPHQLSGGQRRRLAIARALVTEPILVLADEPTNDLDDYWSNIIMDLLKDVVLKKGLVMMVTHNLTMSKYANCRYMMDHGKLIKDT